MDNTAAYCLMVFSPILFIQLWLNIRYDIQYVHLRGKHSKTYLEKNRGSFWEWLFYKNFQNELDKGQYLSHSALLWLVMISLVVAMVYGVLYLAKHQIQYYWIPRLYAELDIVVANLFVLKNIHDKVKHK